MLSNGTEKYTPRKLALIELAGKGSCTGPLPFDSSLGALTWESLLAQIDLKIEPWYRSLKGDFTLPGQTTPTRGYWLVIGVVRSSASFWALSRFVPHLKNSSLTSRGNWEAAMGQSSSAIRR